MTLNRLEILVTRRAMELISDPERSGDTKKAVQRAMQAAARPLSARSSL